MSNKGGFDISVEELKELMKVRGEEGVKKLKEKYHSIDELCKKLKTNPQQGLTGDDADLKNRVEVFGKNEIPQKASKSFIRLLWEAVQDVTLIILIIAAAISLGLSFVHPGDDHEPGDDDKGVTSSTLVGEISSTLVGGTTTPVGNVSTTTTAEGAVGTSDAQYEWIEGCAILVSVAVVVFVTAFNDYTKERQFRALQAKLEQEHKFAVIRKNQAVTINDKELVVGDICQIKYGKLQQSCSCRKAETV